MKIFDIIANKGKGKHLLYGRVIGITDRAVTIRVLGLFGRSAIRRICHRHKLAKQIFAPSLGFMVHTTVKIRLSDGCEIRRDRENAIYIVKASNWEALFRKQEIPLIKN